MRRSSTSMATSAGIGDHHGNLAPSIHALRLHRHRVEHDAAARRRRRAGAARARCVQQRSFTPHRTGDPRPTASSPRALIDVRRRRRRAPARGGRGRPAREHLRVVATAAIRRAANRDELLAALRERARRSRSRSCPGEHEARLAFAGATRTLEQPPEGTIAVVDVGGMSTEIAVGTMAGGVTWARSYAIGSSALAARLPRTTRRRPSDVERMPRRRARGVRRRAPIRRADHAIAVGGSAASLPTLVGPVLDAAALERALGVLTCGARRARWRALHDLAPERTQLLPAGILVLGAAAERLGQAAADRPRRAARGRDPRAARRPSHCSTMAKAEDIDVTPDEPYRRAGARIVRVRARELFDQPTGVLDTRDIERVHDMRVASRRLRAVLEIFAPCFPQSEFKGVLQGRQAARRRARRAARPRRAHRRAATRSPGRSPPANKPGVARHDRGARGASGARQRGAGRRARARGAARSARPAARARGRRRRRARRAARVPEAVAAVKARKVGGLDPEAGSPTTPSGSSSSASTSCAASCRRRPIPTRSSRCTTCASPPSGCATSSRSPARASARTRRPRPRWPRTCRTCWARSTTATSRCPRPRRSPSGCSRTTSRRCTRRPEGAEDLDPALLKQAPHARDHAGLAALQAHLRARRRLLFDRFLELWGDYERKGFRARLEYAVGERAAVQDDASSVSIAES